MIMAICIEIYGSRVGNERLWDKANRVVMINLKAVDAALWFDVCATESGSRTSDSVLTNFTYYQTLPTDLVTWSKALTIFL